MQPNQPYTPTPDQDPTEIQSNNQSELPNAWDTPAQPLTPLEHNQPQSASQYAQPQQPAPLTQNDQLSSGVPPAPRKSRKGLLIIGGAVVTAIILAAAAGTYAWMQQQNDPQQRLYRALESHMKTSYIQQDYTELVAGSSIVAIHVNGTSDLSSPASPKSYIKYSRAVNKTGQVFSAGEQVALTEPEYFGKASKLYSSLGLTDSRGKPTLDQWYRIDHSDDTADLTFDPIGLIGEVNTSTGDYLVGNFDNKARTELMNIIKTQNVYTINSSENTSVDGEAATKYSVTINSDQLSRLNDKAIELLGLTQKTPVKVEDGQTNTLWVSHKTGRIMQTERTTESQATNWDGSKIANTKTAKITYPTDVSAIAEPSNSIDWK